MLYDTLKNLEWTHGAVDCASNDGAIIQTHAIDDSTFILRVDQCYSFEGNFIYLMVGRDKALLLDTGPAPDDRVNGKILPIREVVDALIATCVPNDTVHKTELIVAHTHGHADHAFWDHRFEQRENTIVVKPSTHATIKFFGLLAWPGGRSLVDLGDRFVTVFPTPGHEDAHICVYDEQSRALFTGDFLYPGVLTVRDWASYLKTARQVMQFSNETEISAILGSHIEMKNQPGEYYEYGTRYQPDEHPLPLSPDQLIEWGRTCESMADSPVSTVRDSYIIEIL